VNLLCRGGHGGNEKCPTRAGQKRGGAGATRGSFWEGTEPGLWTSRAVPAPKRKVGIREESSYQYVRHRKLVKGRKELWTQLGMRPGTQEKAEGSVPAGEGKRRK